MGSSGSPPGGAWHSKAAFASFLALLGAALADDGAAIDGLSSRREATEFSTGEPFDALWSASYIADVDGVANLLARSAPGVVYTDIGPVPVDRPDRLGRRPLAVCGLDPQFPTATPTREMLTALDDRCAAISHALLDAGADVNAADGHGWSAVAMFSVKGLKRCVALLALRGADVNAADAANAAPLMKVSARLPFSSVPVAAATLVKIQYHN